MSSSIEEYFQPPEWSTKEEVTKAAQTYINYWKIEAKHRNGQWLEAMKENDFLNKSCEAKDKYIDHLLERIEQLETSIISGGAIVPDAKPFEE